MCTGELFEGGGGDNRGFTVIDRTIEKSFYHCFDVLLQTAVRLIAKVNADNIAKVNVNAKQAWSGKRFVVRKNQTDTMRGSNLFNYGSY